MKFSTFLETTLTSGHNPSTQLKIDLSVWKDTFNFATKTDELYDSLINNILIILTTKFSSFNIVYNNADKMYDEMKLTLIPQLPQFLMIQKKQLLENLNTFASLNNWGDNLKNSVVRTLNLQDTTENNAGYVPIDGQDKDPYTSNDGTVNRTGTDSNEVTTNAINYLEYYKLIRWNVADLELDKILKPYYRLFVLYDIDVSETSTGGSTSDLQIQIDELKKIDVMLGEEIDNLELKTTTMNENISQLQQNVSTNTNGISSLGERVTTIEGKYGKLDENNTWEGRQFFNWTTSFNDDLSIDRGTATYYRMNYQGVPSTTLVNKYYVDAQDSTLTTKINQNYDAISANTKAISIANDTITQLRNSVNNQAQSLQDLNSLVTQLNNDIDDIINPQVSSYEYSISRIEALGGLVRYQEFFHTFPEGKTISYANILVDLQTGFANVMNASKVRDIAYFNRNGFCRLMVSPTLGNETNAWYAGLQIDWNFIDSETSTCMSIRVFKPYDELIAQDKDYIKNNLVIGLYEYI